MKVTTKKLSDTSVELKVVLDKNDLKEAEEKAITRLVREVKIEGFRKGKAPLDMAKKAINPNELANVSLDIAVRTSVPKAFEEGKSAPLMIPNVEVTKFVPGETVEYTAKAEILPDIKLGNYKKLGIKRETIKVTEKDINEILENIQNAYAEKKVAKKKAEMGDEVVIDFEGSLNGEKFEGGAAKDFTLGLGSKQFIPGFEEGIVGHESGDRFDLELTFPKDYHAEKLAGKKTVFNVLVKQVSEKIKPALDDELAKKCGPFKTIDELKADIKKNLETQNAAKTDEKFKDDLVNKLVEKSTVSAPEIMIKDQLNLIKNDISANAARQGLKFEDFLKQTGQTEEDWEKEAKKIAEQRVKASLCLQILARDEKIEVEEKVVDAKIAELREVYKKSKEALKNLKDPNVRQDIKNRLTIEKTLNYLVELNSK
ncbi:MAG: trigger factor [Candidatus Saccharibacteria bacterium]|nr:trigger factor [Candidatus Saccharibacteria bacterium]